jgi:DNA mismatch repair protein PMS2
MELPSTEEKPIRIEAINKDVVHQICSGQVVLTLATAVKELVENSLDAGARVIEVRLKEYGSEFVEVIDNGTGVQEENFEGLTLKHHTSKLRVYSDLVSVETFGFRGEALSSLCALSNMTVITRHASASCGTRLEFDHKGQIIQKKCCARQVGTTVSLQNLFSSLPVRQKEFHRNLRREFSKMTQLLYAYCLVCTGTKISCTNQTKNGGRTLVVSTQGGETVRDNIACIFGAKQVHSLMEFLPKMPSETILQEYGISGGSALTESPFQLEGCISSCAHGQGRSTTDRQFFYVNSRPCEPTKVTKLVNEVYHQFNQYQYPFVFLNLKMAHDIVDVNVTPDKRQVFMDHEKLLTATIKASLLHLYETVPSTYNFQNISSDPVPHTLPSQTAAANLEDIFKQWSHSSAYNPSTSPTSTSGIGRGVKRPFNSTRKEDSGKSKLHCINHFFSPTRMEGVKNTPTKLQTPTHNIADVEDIFITAQDMEESESTKIGYAETDNTVTFLNPDEETSTTLNQADGEHAENEVGRNKHIKATETDVIVINDAELKQESVEESLMTRQISFGRTEQTGIIQMIQMKCKDEEIKQPCGNEVSVDTAAPAVVRLDDEKMDGLSRKVVHMSISIESIKKQIEHKKHKISGDKNEVSVKFRAEIDPAKSQAAERELRKEISQDMFAKMEILGQFNLGFIVTRLGPDLFIIDQHATDEKYNFEMLQLNTVLQNQRLVM